MAAQDTAGKWYMSDNAIFADAFNFLLYDAIDYSKQVEEAGRSYRRGKDSGTFSEKDDGTLEIKLTHEEFLSGFRKADRLIQ